MPPPKAPKTPSGKAPKGTVQVVASHGRLQLRFRHQGKRRYLSIGLPDSPTNRIVAQQTAGQIQLDIISGNFDNTLAKYKPTANQPQEKVTVEIPSVSELWDSFCEIKRQTVAPGTWRNGYCVNTRHLTRCPYKKLEDAQKIYDWAVTTLKPDPARRLIQALSSCCKWAKRANLIETNPFEGLSAEIKIPKKSAENNDIDPFTQAERQTIIEAFTQSKYYAHYTSLVKFLFFTGCRPSEAAGLQWKHISPQEIVFDQAVVDSVYGRVLKEGLKTQSKRKFPINRQLHKLLSELRTPDVKVDDFVFPSPNGNYLNCQNFRSRGWTPILAQLGIRYRKPYQARHTFITHCLQEGISVQQVAKWVGNSPEIIMKHYAGILEQLQVPEI